MSAAIRPERERAGARRVLIVGGVAGGASCAARLRRLEETASIAIFDRGPHVSFANCGLPYFVGDVITDESELLLASPDTFRQRFDVDVHVETEAIAIDREAHTLTVRHLPSGVTRSEPYDVLVLAPGAAPIQPPLPGVDRPGVFTVRSIPDTRRIRAWIEEHRARRAVVVGGGFIGLEMAENLAHRGLTVAILEKLPQVMPPLDPEMAAPVMEHLRARGVELRLGDGLARIDPGDGNGLDVVTESGARLAADLVILAIGVRPEVGLARAAGIALGARGGIAVDEAMRTSDPHVWAVGDAVETRDVVTGQEVVLPSQGRRTARAGSPPSRSPGVPRASAACRPPPWWASSA